MFLFTPTSNMAGRKVVTMLTMLILLPLCFITFYGFYLWMVANKYSHLPCHLGSEFPIIGNLYYSFKNSFISHDDLLALLERILPEFGGISVIWVYFKPVLALSDPLIVEKLSKDPAFADKEPLVYQNVPNLMKGIFTYALSDKKLKQRRKIFNISMKEKNMISYHDKFVKVSRRTADNMEKEKGVFNVERYMKMASFEAILATHYGLDLNLSDDQEIYRLAHWGETKLAESFMNPIFGFFMNIYIAVSSVLKPMENIMKESVKNQMDKQKNAIEDLSENLYIKDVIQQYASFAASYKEIKQELIELMLVGLHSTGTGLSAALVLLSALPEIQDKLWEEQENIFGESDRDPTITDVKRMDYLERYIKEVFRFVSAPYVCRRTRNDIVIDDKLIPKNTTILICGKLMRMNDDYWENPSKFDPDRYLQDVPTKNYKNAFSSFGYGIRNCPGLQYAFIETTILISTILRRFKIVTDRKFEDIKLTPQIMMEIKGGYHISVEKREKY